MKSCVVAVYTICDKYGMCVDAVVVLARCQYTPGQYNDNTNMQIVYKTTTQDFVRIVTTK